MMGESTMARSVTTGILAAAVLMLAGFSAYLSIRMSRLEQQVDADRAPIYSECDFELRCRVSMYELLTHPYRYDGKKVQIMGYYFSGFEMSAIFADLPAPDKDLNFRDAVWLEGSTSALGQNGSAVTVVGTFHAGPSGHLGQYPGELIAAPGS